MSEKTLINGLVEVQNIIKENIKQINSTTGTKDALEVPTLRADAITKLSRQYINSAQTLIRLGKLHGEITEATTL